MSSAYSSGFSPRPLATAVPESVQRANDAPAGRTAGPEERIEFRIVEVREGNYFIDGQRMPTSSIVQFSQGEMVPVLFRRGVPVAILGHQARRSGLGIIPAVVVGVVEELFIARDLKTGLMEVWFRNDRQITRLRSVRDQIGAGPTGVEAIVVAQEDASW